MSLVVALTVLAPLFALVAPPAHATVALRDYLLLPVPSASQLVPVPSTSLLVVASWEGDITIVDRSTGTMSAVPGTTAVGELTWNSARDRLIGFPRGGSSIVELDPMTGEVRSWTVSGCPVAAASVGGRILYADGGYDCSRAQNTTLMWLDPVTGQSDAVAQEGLSWDFIHPYGTKLLAQPGTSNLLVAEADRVWVVDIGADGSLAILASQQLVNRAFLTDEGDALVVGHQLRGLPNLELLDDYLGGSDTDLTQVSASLITGAYGERGRILRRSDGSDVNTFITPLYLPHAPGFVDAKVVGDKLYALENSLADPQDSASSQARLYSMQGASVPAPEVTIDRLGDGPFYWGDPMLLRGRVTQEGVPVAGATVDLSQFHPVPGTALGSAVTGVDGTWTYEFTPPAASWYLLQAGHLSDDRLSVARVRFTVDKQVSTIEYVEQPVAQPGDALTFTGGLAARGIDLAGRTITWDLQCWDSAPYSLYPSLLTTTTAVDGKFTVQHKPRDGEVCAHYALNAWWDGDDRYQLAQKIDEQLVAWRQSDLQLAVPASAYVEDEVVGTLTLTVDGVATAGETVHVTIRRPDFTIASESDAVTGADGTVPVSVVPAVPGNWTVKAQRASNADTRGDTVTATVAVARVATTLSLDPLPASLVVGGTVPVRGRLARADGRNEGVSLQLMAVDASGMRRDHVTTSTADGTFVFSDAPPVTGTTRYSVRYVGDNRYLTAEKSAAVTVEPHTPTVTLQTDRLVYNAGQTASIRVNVADSETRRVVVKTFSAAGTTVLFDGTLPATGLVLNRRLWFNTTVVATHPADARHTAHQVSARRLVRLGLGTTALRPLERSGAYAVYGSGADPVLLTSTTPARAGICVRMRLQRYLDAAWRTVHTSACVKSDQYGRARWTFGGAQPAASRYRAQAFFAGDAVSAASVGPWTYVRFVR